MRKLLFIIGILLTGFSGFSQSKEQIAKQKNSIIEYNKKNYFLYTPKEWKVESSFIVEDVIDDKIQTYIDRVFQRDSTYLIKDTLYVKGLLFDFNRVCHKNKIGIFYDRTSEFTLIEQIGSVWVSFSDDKIQLNFLDVNKKDTLSIINTDGDILITGGSDFVGIKLGVLYSKILQYEKVYTNTYVITHVYEAMTKGGSKRYFTTDYTYNKKTSKLIKVEDY